jgi:hypothetical protein
VHRDAKVERYLPVRTARGIQVTDPQIEAAKKKAIIDELRKGAGL